MYRSLVALLAFLLLALAFLLSVDISALKIGARHVPTAEEYHEILRDMNVGGASGRAEARAIADRSPAEYPLYGVRVLTHKGAPLLGLQARFRALDSSLELDLVTNDEGKAVSSRILPGPYRILFGNGALATVQISRVVPIQDIKVEPPQMVFGKVRNSTSFLPVPSAHIYVANVGFDSDVDFMPQYRVSPGGDFAITTISPHAVFFVDAEGFARSRTFVAADVPAEGFSISLDKADASLQIDLTVDHEPYKGGGFVFVSDDRASASMAPAGRLLRTFRRRAEVDASGSACFPGVTSGVYVAEVRLPGRASFRQAIRVMGDTVVALEVGRSEEVVGRVVDQDGNPIEGAELWVDSRDSALASSSSDDGSFSLSGVSRVRHEVLQVQKGDVRQSVAIAEAGEVVVTLRSNGAIHGSIEDELGRPWEGLNVTLRGSYLGNPVVRRRGSDGEGRFYFDWCSDRQYELVVEAGSGRVLACAAVRASAEPKRVVIAREAGARLRGRVSHGDGSRVFGAVIAERSDGAGSLAWTVGVDSIDGAFEFVDLIPGRYRISAAVEGAPDQMLAQVSLASGEEADLGRLILKEAGALQVELVGLTAGESVAVSAWPEVGDKWRALVLREGRWCATNLAPGTYTVRVRSEFVVAEPETVELRAGGSAHVQLTLAKGSPSFVVLEGGSPNGVFDTIHMEIFDSDGAVVWVDDISTLKAADPIGLGCMGPGRYEIHVRNERGQRGSVRVTVPVGNEEMRWTVSLR